MDRRTQDSIEVLAPQEPQTDEGLTGYEKSNSPESQDYYSTMVGRRALGSLGIANPEATENERREVFKENIRVLTKRFGETFVKGERIDSNRHSDNGARSILSAFLERPGAADRIKRLIPSKHLALPTLQDNQDYIYAVLSGMYEEESSPKHEQASQDPYELARQAGYELTGPLRHVSEFENYEKDFRPAERLCTFDNPRTRLSEYHILWLRRPDIDEIAPAGQLTPKNLSQAWKNYLRTTGRYDSSTDTYDLEDLNPAREDPYGTSSMSVQVSRTGGLVSIKNRYNDSVANPDNTYHNNLDNIADGLKIAVYNKVGRNDLMDVTEVQLSNKYTLDESGGIHPYYYRKGNLYLGEYEYIKNGVVTTIDKGAYDMLSPEVYASRKNDDQIISPTGKQTGTSFGVAEDGTHNLRTYSPEGQPQVTYSYSYDERGKIGGISMTIHPHAEVISIHGNPVLTRLTADIGATVRNIYSNPALTNLAISEHAKVGNVTDNPLLTQLKIGPWAIVANILNNPALTNLAISESAKVRYTQQAPRSSDVASNKGE